MKELLICRSCLFPLAAHPGMATDVIHDDSKLIRNVD